MNKEYLIRDDKIVVTDEYGRLREVDNSDNVNEILEQENILETVDNEIDKYFELSEINVPKESTLLKNIKNSIICVLIPIVLELVLKLFGINMLLLNLGFTELTSTTYLSCCLAFFAIINNAYIAIREHKDRKRCKKLALGLSFVLDYLGKTREIEQKKLEELKKNKKLVNNYICTDEPTKINEPKRIKEIENCEIVNLKLGKKFKKYYHDYLNGVLHFTLEKEKDIHNMDLYYDYIEEYGPQLIKHFRHTDMY